MDGFANEKDQALLLREDRLYFAWKALHDRG